MRQIIVLAVVIAVVTGAAVPSATRREYYAPGDAQILRYDVDNIGLGNYRYAYEQTDGTRQEQQGAITNEGREDEAIAVKGSFSWIAPNGIRYTVTYTSDVDGYKPTLEEGPGGLPDVALISALGYEAADDSNQNHGTAVKDLSLVKNDMIVNINNTLSEDLPYKMDTEDFQSPFLTADVLISALGG